MSSSLSSSGDEPPPSVELPLRELPGSYGFPFFSPIKDRLDFFYRQGPEEFFQTRIQKHGSTVFRTNMPPGPLVAPNSRFIVLLDVASYPILFDTSRVEKSLLVGNYMPSAAFNGGFRCMAYLDPSTPKHHDLKSLVFALLHSSYRQIIPIFDSGISEFFVELENEISANKKASFNTLIDKMVFDFLFRLWNGYNVTDTAVKTTDSAMKLVRNWLLPQLSPQIILGLKYVPSFIEDFLIHTIMFPFFIVKSDYKKLYDAFSKSTILDQAEKFGLSREEACHNLVFMFSVNGFGGIRRMFATMIGGVGSAGETLHRSLREEIRTVVESEGGVTLTALEKMPLVTSVAYEALRFEPPAPIQYAKAKGDVVVQSHDASFQIKKGDLLCGYLPVAMRDPKVFADPNDFVGDRFVGDGEKLIKYVYWSNAFATSDPGPDDKQCPAKDLVLVVSRLLLAHFFLRYDTFTVEVEKVPTGSSVTIKSLTKAT